jgi:N-methylhydantoinase A/oxoprolinase/acetone carboxylase beta subunit
VTETSRPVVWHDAAGPVPTRVLSGRLPDMRKVPGPLIIEEYDSTILVPPGWAVSGAAMNSLELTRMGGPGDGQ